MKCLCRRVFNGVAAIVMLLCLGAWIFSHFRAYQVAYWGVRARVIVVLDGGHILCEVVRHDPDLRQAGWQRWYQGLAAAGGFGQLSDWDHTQPAWYHRLGFAGEWGRADQFPLSAMVAEPATDYLLSIPLWIPILLLATPPIRTFRRYRRARLESRKGLCSRCGYDLRATPGRCPECGIVSSGPKISVKK